MGAEIIPYHTLGEIFDRIKREDIVLDYIDQCNAVFGKFAGLSLRTFPGRKIWRDMINHVSTTESLWSAGYFVRAIYFCQMESTPGARRRV